MHYRKNDKSSNIPNKYIVPTTTKRSTGKENTKGKN